MKNFLLTILIGAFTIVNANNDCFHVVVKGDNLYRIGIKYKTNEEGLKKLNPNLSPSLSLGQKVKVPCIEGEQYESVAQKPPVIVSQPDEFQGNYIYHSIVKGETLPEPGLPESFNVLMHELKGLGLDIRLVE